MNTLEPREERQWLESQVRELKAERDAAMMLAAAAEQRAIIYEDAFNTLASRYDLNAEQRTHYLVTARRMVR